MTATTAFALWLALLSASPLVSCQPDSSRWMNVNTSSGPIKGHMAAGQSRVIEYLGIPFAKAPIGALRFEPPQRFAGHGLVEASDYGLSCPSFESGPPSYPQMSPQAQDILGAFTVIKGRGVLQGEDCLNLNIWTKPSLASSDKAKPVVVFIHGGRFALGSGSSPMYTGKHLAAAQDVLVVTFNYRTNIFGFPGIPGSAQNLGLRDQGMAIEWVRDNIAGFGGDPEKIFVFGQSAGSIAIDLWSYAYKDDPIIKGFWAMSGSALTRPVSGPELVHDNFQLVSDAVNCTTASHQMACMREVNWKDLRNAASSLPSFMTDNPLRSWPAFSPSQDNELIFGDYASRSKKGRFAKIPAVFSNTYKEEGYYQLPLLQRGIQPTLKEADTFMLERFTCANSLQAATRTNSGVPSWLVRYFGDFTNTRLYPESGAYHGVDLHMIFGASSDITGLPLSAEEVGLSDMMQRALVAFANDPFHGLEAEMSWPRFNESEKTMILLGVENEVKPRMVFPRNYNAVCNYTIYG